MNTLSGVSTGLKTVGGYIGYLVKKTRQVAACKSSKPKENFMKEPVHANKYIEDILAPEKDIDEFVVEGDGTEKTIRIKGKGKYHWILMTGTIIVSVVAIATRNNPDKNPLKIDTF